MASKRKLPNDFVENKATSDISSLSVNRYGNTKKVSLIREEYKRRSIEVLGEAAILASVYLKEKISDPGLDDRFRIKVAEIILSKVVPNATMEEIDEIEETVKDVDLLKREIGEMVSKLGIEINPKK